MGLQVPEYLIEFTKLVLQYVLPSILGASGLLAVWYNWRVEREREKLKRRRELIDSWRRELLSDWNGTIRLGGPQAKYEFMDKSAYWSLRSHLSAEFRNKIEGPAAVIVRGGNGGMYPRNLLSDEISRIEREWNLV